VLIPSTSETGAIAVLEAMASGKVVIASDINPIKEYIQHGRTGFLFRHEEEVCSYLKRLIGSPDLIMEIGTRASESTKKYDWQLLIRKYEEMYESVVAQKARDRP
jgi:glycosyltransferase involved in cell wall biosynthesis